MAAETSETLDPCGSRRAREEGSGREDHFTQHTHIHTTHTNIYQQQQRIPRQHHQENFDMRQKAKKKKTWFFLYR